MQTEFKIVIADTSCFILLTNIGELDLLKALFGKVITTPIIAKEFGEFLPEWIEIKPVKNIILQNSLDVDPGEASAIALALEFESALLIIDDNKGRKAAQKLNLNITGSLGIFLKAKKSGIIPVIKPIIEKLQQTNFRYSPSIMEEILTLAGE